MTEMCRYISEAVHIKRRSSDIERQARAIPFFAFPPRSDSEIGRSGKHEWAWTAFEIGGSPSVSGRFRLLSSGPLNLTPNGPVQPREVAPDQQA